MRLQKAPLGLLDLFALKSDGSNPTQFGDGLLPVTDVGDLYTYDRTVTAQSTGITAALGTDTTTFPTPVLLRTVGFAFSEGAAAGTFMHVSINAHIGGSGVSTPIFYQSFGGIAAGAARRSGIMLPRPLLLPGGSQIIAIFTGDAAGADHVQRTSWTITNLAP